MIEELAASSEYASRRAAIAEFNKTSPVIKRGIALTPLKFGISFNATLYNQAGAAVNIYADGTVLVTHGGTEMGQGLYTKIQQIVAHELGISTSTVRLSSTDTSRVPNTSATAASSGADLNGKAAQAAAFKIKQRLTALFALHHGVPADSVTFANDHVHGAEGVTTSFATLVLEAYRSRVQLWDSGFYSTPKIHWNKETLQGKPFFYYAYGASCAEVAVDTLTGESKVLRVDILHDVGKSLNPAIDIGQIEGGFIQGMGWLTTEELWFRPEGAQLGRNMTHAPSTYKIPAASDCPPIMNVRLFDNANVEETIHKSKAVGEPPLMLAFSVFFALRDACWRHAAAARHCRHRPRPRPSSTQSTRTQPHEQLACPARTAEP
jgi:xanthine dehydrogenase large subunit